MIQCPICQMVNDDNTRFCAECGARLGPAPAPAPTLQAQPPQAPPTPPPAKLHSPILGGGAPQESAPQYSSGPQPGSDAAEIDRLKRMASRPEVPQTDGVPRNPFDPRNDPRNQPQNQPQNQAGQGAAPPPPAKKLRSPLLASDEDDYDDQGPGPISSRSRAAEPPQSQSRGHLHSPLLGDAAGHHEVGQGSSGRQHLHSPLLGDAVHDPAAHPPQQSSGRQHLHSPLLGDAAHDPVAEQYIAPASTSGSGRHHLHSPLLGGGDDDQDYYEEEPPVQRRGGLHSPILGGGGGGRGGLRSPMLSSAGGGSDFQDQYYEEEEDPYADEGNPNILRSPLLSSKIDAEQHAPRPAAPRPPQNPQPARPQPPAQAQAQYQQAPQPPAQPQYQAPAPQPVQPMQPVAPQYEAPAFQSQAPVAPLAPEPAPIPAAAPAEHQPVTKLAALAETKLDEFPDMTHLRRDEPASYVPPELAPADISNLQSSNQAISSGFASQPAAAVAPVAPPPAPAAPLPVSAAPPPAPIPMSSPPAAPPPQESKPLRRSSSKLLGDDYGDDADDFDSGRSFAGPGSRSGGPAPFAPPAQASSPIPKMMGGVAIFLALGKMPLVIQYLPSLMDARYTVTVVDAVATTAALIALGLALIMSKN